MKKESLLIFLSFSVIAFGVFVYCKSFQHKIALEDVLVKAEDLSATDFNVHDQDIFGMDFYDSSLNKEVLKDRSNFIKGDYDKNGNYISLFSQITQYVNADVAKSNFDIFISPPFANPYWTIEEVFTPNFTNSTYYQYKQCAFISQTNNPSLYSCKIASMVKDDYIFTLGLHGYGIMERSYVEYLLEKVLKNRDSILERLP